MNRSIRNFLFFCLGFSAIAVPMLAYAETKPAIPHVAGSLSVAPILKWTAVSTNPARYDTLTQVCNAVRAKGSNVQGTCADTVVGTNGLTSYGSCGYYTASCWYYGGESGNVMRTPYCDTGYVLSGSVCVNTSAVYTCETGGNWTLSGQTCTRPDCSPGQSYSESGICSPVCVGAQFLDPATNTCKCIYKAPSTNSYQVSEANARAQKLDPPTCNNGCVTAKTGYISFCPGGLVTMIVGGSTTCYAETFQSGEICSNSGSGSGSGGVTVTLSPVTAPAAPAGTNPSGSADPLSTTPNNGDPIACSQAGGNWGVFNGKGSCYTPSKTDPVITQKEESTRVANPSTGKVDITTTTTTQTCTGAGSCTTSTTTNVSSGGVAGNTVTTKGQGGTGSANITADGAGNFKLDLPKDYQKDSTGLLLNAMVKDLSDVIGKPSADDTSITEAGASADAKKGLEDSDKADTAAVNGDFNAQIKTSQSAWQESMRTWWQPIAITGCHPFSATIAGRPWVLDHCEKAAEISAIGAYVAWIGLLFAGFRLLTTPRSGA